MGVTVGGRGVLLTWDEAADLLELFLEDAAGLADGEEPGELPDVGHVVLDGQPSEATEARIVTLLTQTEEAMAALAQRKAEIRQEMDHMGRLRSAGAGYIRYDT